MTPRTATSAKPLRAAIYVRISRDREGAGLGVDRQEKDCRALARKLGVIVVGLYADNDLSASSGKRRPQYERLLHDMADGLVDVVLVWHTDRLHRRPLELESFIEVAESRRPVVTVHAVKAGPLDLATPAGRMVARQLGAVARYEVEHKSERQKAANAQRAERGLPTGGQRPFGFEPGGLKHRRREADALRKATADVLAGETMYAIARRWNAAQLLTSAGKEWSPDTVRQVLRRPRNAGLKEYHGACGPGGKAACNGYRIGTASARTQQTCQLFPAAWKPVVPEEQWRALIKLLDDPARRSSTGNRPKWLLSGLARCGTAGCDLTMRTGAQSRAAMRNGEPMRVYRCRSGGHVTRKADVIDDFVTRLVIARLSRPDALQLLEEEHNVDLTALHAKARELRGRQEALALEAAHGEITPAQLTTINRTIGAELAQIEEQITGAAQVNVLADLAGRDDVEKRWHALSLDRKRAVIETLLTITILPMGRGYVPAFDPDTVLVEWRSPGSPAVPVQPKRNGPRPRVAPSPQRRPARSATG